LCDDALLLALLSCDEDDDGADEEELFLCDIFCVAICLFLRLLKFFLSQKKAAESSSAF